MQLINWSLEKNVGKTDKAVRSTLAVGLLTAAFCEKASTAEKALLFLGAGALLATTISGKCPLYQATGIDTRNYNE